MAFVYERDEEGRYRFRWDGADYSNAVWDFEPKPLKECPFCRRPFTEKIKGTDAASTT
jgi:hypothetical protein